MVAPMGPPSVVMQCVLHAERERNVLSHPSSRNLLCLALGILKQQSACGLPQVAPRGGVKQLGIQYIYLGPYATAVHT